jgi:hypothetical protein
MKAGMRRLLLGCTCGLAIACFAGEIGVEASSLATMTGRLIAPAPLASGTDKNGSHAWQSGPLPSHNASWTALFHAVGR